MLTCHTTLSIITFFAILRTLATRYRIPIIETTTITLITLIESAAFLAAFDTLGAFVDTVFEESSYVAGLFGALAID